MSLIRDDLKSAVFFYDIPFAAAALFPARARDNIAVTDLEARRAPPPIPEMDRRFDFAGEREALQFTAGAYIQTDASSAPRFRVARVAYFLRPCARRPASGAPARRSSRRSEQSQCLARAVSLEWTDIEDSKNQIAQNMLQGVKSAQFSYFHEGGWENEWSLSQRLKDAPGGFGKISLLPSLVKMDMEWEDGGEESFQFAAGSHLTAAHHPGRISGLARLRQADKAAEKKPAPSSAEKPAEAEDSSTAKPRDKIPPGGSPRPAPNSRIR